MNKEKLEQKIKKKFEGAIKEEIDSKEISMDELNELAPYFGPQLEKNVKEIYDEAKKSPAIFSSVLDGDFEREEVLNTILDEEYPKIKEKYGKELDLFEKTLEDYSIWRSVELDVALSKKDVKRKYTNHESLAYSLRNSDSTIQLYLNALDSLDIKNLSEEELKKSKDDLFEKLSSCKGWDYFKYNEKGEISWKGYLRGVVKEFKDKTREDSDPEKILPFIKYLKGEDNIKERFINIKEKMSPTEKLVTLAKIIKDTEDEKITAPGVRGGFPDGVTKFFTGKLYGWSDGSSDGEIWNEDIVAKKNSNYLGILKNKSGPQGFRYSDLIALFEGMNPDDASKKIYEKIKEIKRDVNRIVGSYETACRFSKDDDFKEKVKLSNIIRNHEKHYPSFVEKYEDFTIIGSSGYDTYTTRSTVTDYKVVNLNVYDSEGRKLGGAGDRFLFRTTANGVVNRGYSINFVGAKRKGDTLEVKLEGKTFDVELEGLDKDLPKSISEGEKRRLMEKARDYAGKHLSAPGLKIPTSYDQFKMGQELAKTTGMTSMPAGTLPRGDQYRGPEYDLSVVEADEGGMTVRMREEIDYVGGQIQYRETDLRVTKDGSISELESKVTDYE